MGVMDGNIPQHVWAPNEKARARTPERKQGVYLQNSIIKCITTMSFNRATIDADVVQKIQYKVSPNKIAKTSPPKPWQHELIKLLD